MKFSGFSQFSTGVLVPVFSLRTKDSLGCGEFADLVLLSDWCKAADLDIIQLLPVNDTGDDSSPYNALSAFALHPAYMRIINLPEFLALETEATKQVQKSLESAKKKFEALPRVEYGSVLKAKLSILEEIFKYSHATIAADAVFTKWLSKNGWARDYAAFKALKVMHRNEGWQGWRPEYRFGNNDVIERIWKDPKLNEKALFFAWLQFRLEEQFLAAAQYLNKNGILLKGDLPIMMNEDSVDVWAHGQNFHLDLRAGAPPDMFSKMGQNWGFPIYNWDYLQKHDYQWWRDRLKQADKFYHAYRIDHVLGFFRIWTIDRHHKDGLLGYFQPSIFLSRNDLFSIGFDEARIKWLVEPHISGQSIRDKFGMRSIEVMGRCFNRLGDEDLYVFKPELRGERDVQEIPLFDEEREVILKIYQDRALILVDEGLYSPAWHLSECERFYSLPEAEKQSFHDLVAKRAFESEQLWEKQGTKLLQFMIKTVPMLTCAEDLGVIPNCVPGVLNQHGILSLKIPRWARTWDAPGQPYIDLKQYPFLSVCAPSVHDTSSLREWWESSDEKIGFWSVLGLEDPCPSVYDEHVAKKVILRILECNSVFCLFQIQDLFALQADLRIEDAKQERINIPGTIQSSNWSYRIPFSLESLIEHATFSKSIKELVKNRKSRTLPI